MSNFIQIFFIVTITILLLWRTIKSCKISEFQCHGICLPLDKYCDGREDCGDGSDEPKYCTVCNRTYYGDIGRTYSLIVPPPQWNRLPFLCHITFTASGHEQGDIVQIIFDGFSVGRFDEGLADTSTDIESGGIGNSEQLSISNGLSFLGDLPGCPEGFMQLSELGRPFTGGSWCGTSTGPQLYYSETSTVTASVKVFHAPLQSTTPPFEFRIRYKFIKQSDATVRYGPPEGLLELGRVTPGTYCTRQFDECHRKTCRLQSPNYPGMYPRNVTCYWTIRQKEVPTCKHAMIAISQEDSHKALVKRSIAYLNKTYRSIRAWSDCTGERDHLIFYDGSSTNDPVLAKYCGGDWLPRVISRGSEMLIAFHSSPFSAPLQTNIPNRGFELNVDILFADSDSHDFAKGARGACEFHINASNPDDVLLLRRGRMGRILSPRHTLPPNTTCTYYFYGHPDDKIWFAFTSHSLSILQHVLNENSSSVGRYDLPPFITRLRIWDSIGTGRSSRNISIGSANSSLNGTDKLINLHRNYFYSPLNPIYGKDLKVNVDNVWNPVDGYVYGPTLNTIFNNQQSTPPTDLLGSSRSGFDSLIIQKFDKFGLNTGSSTTNSRDSFNYGVNKNRKGNTGVDHLTSKTDDGYDSFDKNRNRGRSKDSDRYIDSDWNRDRNRDRDQRRKDRENDNTNYRGSNEFISNSVSTELLGNTGSSIYSGKRSKNKLYGDGKSAKDRQDRRLIGEFFDHEAPRICDHSLLETGGNKMRPCSPLESYVSNGNNLKIEFHTYTGTALYPASFILNYEFVDTKLDGDEWDGLPERFDRKKHQLSKVDRDDEFKLCSRVFRNRQGNVQSPRNVFLHGRGGAKNLTCLYRFEAPPGERIRLTFYNVSFGLTAACNTDADIHTGRPKCVPSDDQSNESRIGELKLYDVPYDDVKIPLGCFCDNTSSLYRTPLVMQSQSNTMELIFNVTKLNISEDFADIYFNASYEHILPPTKCSKRQRLTGTGGGDAEAVYPLKGYFDETCATLPWYIETEHQDRSLFIMTWGSFLPMDYALDDALLRCNTKNRLIIYAGRPLRVMKIVCPTQSGGRPSALHIFSEEWIHAFPSLHTTSPVNMVIEPILKEPGTISFQWLEIQRTRSSLIQQLDIQMNYTNNSVNNSLDAFGLVPKIGECENKCPELDACISSKLWCDGRPNCPSGYDESEEECGTARKLLESPAGIFAALGCVAAIIAACLIFLLFDVLRKRKKSLNVKSLNGTAKRVASHNGTLQTDFRKDPLYFDPNS